MKIKSNQIICTFRGHTALKKTSKYRSPINIQKSDNISSSMQSIRPLEMSFECSNEL